MDFYYIMKIEVEKLSTRLLIGINWGLISDTLLVYISNDNCVLTKLGVTMLQMLFDIRIPQLF